MLDAYCLIKQSEIDPNFKETFIEKIRDIDDVEFTYSQRNRTWKLMRLLSSAFRDRKFDFLVVDAMRIFIRETVFLDRGRILAYITAFTKIPRFYHTKAKERIYEKIKGGHCPRKTWGRKPLIIETFEKYDLNADKYLEILSRALEIHNKIS